ncbi:hypothetical protein PILCRDRAFT_507714 [Piloderma croceum F 1598]|uniref:Uncharacterized protein n=1 Tax=Piloderma croceum (strain F 1598) TaxID=765440 RepID=A0A0C3FNI7_PILCF|nr:hypothetical protein PILCRDRAFT_507714 [Piloderma croceum F 1598]
MMGGAMMRVTRMRVTSTMGTTRRVMKMGRAMVDQVCLFSLFFFFGILIPTPTHHHHSGSTTICTTTTTMQRQGSGNHSSNKVHNLTPTFF